MIDYILGNDLLFWTIITLFVMEFCVSCGEDYRKVTNIWEGIGHVIGSFIVACMFPVIYLLELRKWLIRLVNSWVK